MYKIRVQKKVLRFLDKHKGEKNIKMFSNSLILLKKNPYNNILDIKLLKGKNKYRLRISKYRFIYEVINNELIINFTDGDSKGDIYK